jgi:hypothetical protein
MGVGGRFRSERRFLLMRLGDPLHQDKVYRKKLRNTSNKELFKVPVLVHITFKLNG